MQNKLKNNASVVIILSLCVAFIISYIFIFNDETGNNTTIKLDQNAVLVNSKIIEPVLINHVNPTKKQQLQKKASTEIDFKEDFKGIARLSDKSKGVLETAGVLPTDVQGKEVVYLEFDLNSLRKLEVGDTFDLEIPQTQEIFTAEISLVEKFDNGDKSLISNVLGQGGQLHTSIITVGKDAMYGQFTTISGNWVFESKNEYGWIAAKRDLYKNHVEFEPRIISSKNTGEDYTISPKIKY